HLTDKDKTQLQTHGITEPVFKNQLRTFAEGVPHLNIVAPATIGNGIVQLTEEKLNQLTDLYQSTDKQIVKFIPASGAATRMFKLLHQFLKTYDPDQDQLDKFLEKPEYTPLKKFFGGLENLPFYEIVQAHIKTQNPGYF